MIPKSDQPKSVMDYRPIAYCSVIYKTISKLLCSRLRLVLPDIVSSNQSAFIPDRYIVHNRLAMICLNITIGNRSLLDVWLKWILKRLMILSVGIFFMKC